MFMILLSFLWITMRTMFSTFVLEFLCIIFISSFTYSRRTALRRKRWCHFFVFFFLFSAANQNLLCPDNVSQTSFPRGGAFCLLFPSFLNVLETWTPPQMAQTKPISKGSDVFMKSSPSDLFSSYSPCDKKVTFRFLSAGSAVCSELVSTFGPVLSGQCVVCLSATAGGRRKQISFLDLGPSFHPPPPPPPPHRPSSAHFKGLTTRLCCPPRWRDSHEKLL